MSWRRSWTRWKLSYKGEMKKLQVGSIGFVFTETIEAFVGTNVFCNLFLWLLLLTGKFKYVISLRTLLSNCNPVCINENYDSGMVSAPFEGCLEGVDQLHKSAIIVVCLDNLRNCLTAHSEFCFS